MDSGDGYIPLCCVYVVFAVETPRCFYRNTLIGYVETLTFESTISKRHISCAQKKIGSEMDIRFLRRLDALVDLPRGKSYAEDYTADHHEGLVHAMR